MPFKTTHFKLHQLAEGVFAAIHKDGGAAIGNAGLVDLGDRVLVFDTFISKHAAKDLRRAARELIGKPIAHVVNSHYHNDHIRGNQVFDEAEIISSGDTQRLIDTIGRQELAWDRENAPKLFSEYTGELEKLEDEKQFKTVLFAQNYYRVISESLSGLKLTLPTRTFRESLVLQGPKRRVELLTLAGGHTGDDAIMRLPDDGIAFLSDLLFINNHPFLADGSPEKWIEHLDTFENLDEEVLVPGHGPPGKKKDIAMLAKYIDEIVEKVEESIRVGASLESTLAEGIPAPYLKWDLPTFYESNVRFLYKSMEEQKS